VKVEVKGDPRLRPDSKDSAGVFVLDLYRGVSCTKVPTFPEGNRFPREFTQLNGTKGINHLASGCGINAKKSLVLP
jgi:hypothetical protein